MNRDLYRILEISPEASDEEVKRAYRRIALLYHPDRNQAGAGTEDRFKEANYAYSVLGKRDRRRRYDLYRQFMKHSVRWGLPPSPSQDRVLTELFLDPKLPGLARWLEEIFPTKDRSGNDPSFWTFSKATFRFVRQVVREERTERGARRKTTRPRIVTIPKTVLKKVAGTLIPFGAAEADGRRKAKSPSPGKAGRRAWDRAGQSRGADIEWALPLTQEEAAQGTRLTVSFFRDSHWDRLSLLVPPGTREGVRLRVRNKGNRMTPSGETGDLYLRVMIR
jgi:curved DNA-binding protein CbpA